MLHQINPNIMEKTAVKNLDQNVKSIFSYDKGEKGWHTIRSIDVEDDEIIIECFEGDPVDDYLRENLKHNDILQHVDPECQFIDMGMEHEYHFTINPESKHLFTKQFLTH
jgi:hypothetical protein